MAPKYWFPAKRYGWGWGPPRAWQGRLVLLTFAALLALGAVVLLPRHETGYFVLYTVILCGVLLVVCYVAGEPPSWRWGKK